MRRNNIALYIAIGLIGLSISSHWFHISQQVIAFLSIATLLFTVAQIIESEANYMDEDKQNAFDAASRVGNFNIDDEMMLFFKMCMKYDTSNKRKQWMERVATVISCFAFIVLFVGFAIPTEIPQQISTTASISSTAVLFLSIWLFNKHQERKEQWDDVLMLSLINKKASSNSSQTREQQEKHSGKEGS